MGLEHQEDWGWYKRFKLIARGDIELPLKHKVKKMFVNLEKALEGFSQISGDIEKAKAKKVERI